MCSDYFDDPAMLESKTSWMDAADGLIMAWKRLLLCTNHIPTTPTVFHKVSGFVNAIQHSCCSEGWKSFKSKAEAVQLWGILWTRLYCNPAAFSSSSWTWGNITCMLPSAIMNMEVRNQVAGVIKFMWMFEPSHCSETVGSLMFTNSSPWYSFSRKCFTGQGTHSSWELAFMFECLVQWMY